MQGEKGHPGEFPGEKGEKGVPGVMGYKGEKGQLGQKGNMGEKGHKGNVGPSGPMGLPGPKGDFPGQKGNKGDPSSQLPSTSAIKRSLVCQDCRNWLGCWSAWAYTALQHRHTTEMRQPKIHPLMDHSHWFHINYTHNCMHFINTITQSKSHTVCKGKTWSGS